MPIIRSNLYTPEYEPKHWGNLESNRLQLTSTRISAAVDLGKICGIGQVDQPFHGVPIELRMDRSPYPMVKKSRFGLLIYALDQEEVAETVLTSFDNRTNIEKIDLQYSDPPSSPDSNFTFRYAENTNGPLFGIEYTSHRELGPIAILQLTDPS